MQWKMFALNQGMCLKVVLLEWSKWIAGCRIETASRKKSRTELSEIPYCDCDLSI